LRDSLTGRFSNRLDDQTVGQHQTPENQKLMMEVCTACLARQTVTWLESR
jgi:hypothetical protein